MHSLEDYREIAGDEVISTIYRKARKLCGKRILHINSTNYGGGVAEMLNCLVPLTNNVGIQADWRILDGIPSLFTATKKIHNALQGGSLNLTEIKKRLYVKANAAFSTCCSIDADCVIVHDPQPLPLIKFYNKRQPWIWRCHLDLTDPNKELWEFLKKFIFRYNIVVFSSERYK